LRAKIQIKYENENENEKFFDENRKKGFVLVQSLFQVVYQ